MRKIVGIAALVALTVMGASVAQAQKPVTFGVAAGASFPMGDFQKAVNMGFNGTALLGFSAPSIPLSFRAEGAINQFGFKQGVNGNARILSLTGNAAYSFPTSTPVKPYIIGGAGLYNTKANISGLSSSSSNNKFGFNAGAGIKLPLSGFDTFLEARYNRISTDGGSTSFLPVTFGVMF